MSDETAQETPGFRAAIDELEEILARIEGEETDIDRLGEELRRAAFLLEICRGKIRKAEVEVTQIVQTLEGARETAEPAEPGEPARKPGDLD